MTIFSDPSIPKLALLDNGEAVLLDADLVLLDAGELKHERLTELTHERLKKLLNERRSKLTHDLETCDKKSQQKPY